MAVETGCGRTCAGPLEVAAVNRSSEEKTARAWPASCTSVLDKAQQFESSFDPVPYSNLSGSDAEIRDHVCISVVDATSDLDPPDPAEIAKLKLRAISSQSG